MTRANMPRPLPSPPKTCPGWIGPLRTIPRKLSWGSSGGSAGAKMTASNSTVIQVSDSQPTRPSLRVPATSTAGAASTGSTRAAGATPPAAAVAVAAPCAPYGGGDAVAGVVMVSPAGATGVGSTGSGMADPWVDDGVEDVHREVHDDIDDGDDRHEALQCHVLALEDGLPEEVAHPRDAEEHLDDDSAGDQRADVEAGDGEQGERRWPQGVAPQDPPVGDALRPGHLDEVLLQGLDHVAAEQAHVDGHLAGGEREGRQDHPADVLAGVLAERHVAGWWEPLQPDAEVVGERQAEYEVGQRQ